MNSATLVVRNLLRNKLRTLLTLPAVGLPMALMLFTASIRELLDHEVREAAKRLRLAVHHKISLTEAIPERLRREIASLDPDGKQIDAVSAMTWFGGQVPDGRPLEFGSLAVDAESFRHVWDEYPISSAVEREWLEHKNSAIVGKATADFYGWTAGGEMTLKGTVPPYATLRLRVVHIHSGPDPRVVFIRFDFYDDELKRMGSRHGETSMFWVKCKSAAAMEDVARRIDAMTEETTYPTQTEDESTFFAGFIKATGDIPGKLQWIGLAVVFAMVMVAGNTMSLSIRERTAELAVFRVLGFGRVRIGLMVLAESVGLAMLGTLAGVVPMYAGFRIWEVTDIGFGPMNRFVIPERCVVDALMLGLLTGVLAGIVPVLAAGRLKIVDALRRAG